MAYFTLIQGSVFVTSATTLPSGSPIQILESGAQGPKGTAGVTTIVAAPANLGTSPPQNQLVDGIFAYVLSRQLHYRYNAQSVAAADGTDVIVAAGGVGRWLSTPLVGLQPGGTAGYVLTNQGPGSNPTWSPVKGNVPVVATPGGLNTTPIAADLTNGMIVYVTSRSLHYKYDAVSVAPADGTDILVAAGGTGRWLSMPMIPLQPGTAGYVLSNNGPGSNPTWISSPGGPPTGAAGGGLTGTYPNPTVASIAGLAAGGSLSGTYPNPSVISISGIASGGDLSGTYPNPLVNSITGTTGTINMAANSATFQWPNGVSPTLTIASSAGATTPFTIQGQTTSAGTGGSIYLVPGGGTVTSGSVEFRSSLLGTLLSWKPSNARFAWDAAVTAPGSGQNQSSAGSGVSRVERTQAAQTGSGTAGGTFDHVIGARDGAGGLSGFNFSRETVVGSTYFNAFTIVPGAALTNDVLFQKQGTAGNATWSWPTTASAAGGSFLVTGQAGGTGTGGAITLVGGTAGSAGAGGAFSATGGASSVAAVAAGGATLSGGASTNSGAGGGVSITSGGSTAGTAGAITLQLGTGVTKSTVNIKNSAGTNKLIYAETADTFNMSAPLQGDSAAAAGAQSFRHGFLAIDLGGGTTKTLSATEAQYPVLLFTNAGGVVTLTLPDDVGAVRYILNRSGSTINCRTVSAVGLAPSNIASTNGGIVGVFLVAGVPSCQRIP